jgi:hypothetical protein
VFRVEQVRQWLPEMKLGMTLNTFGIYVEPCNGGLYLIDGHQQSRLVRINESWWLYAFKSASWKDSDDANEIVVTASYATGIGPTGAIPFRARIVLQRDASDWIVQEPVVLDDKTEHVATNSDVDGTGAAPPSRNPPWITMRSADSAKAFNTIGVVDRGRPFAIDVDYSKYRLVVDSVVLTSGSATVEDVTVQRREGHYVVSYRVRMPRLGTTDMKQSLVYVILPQDGLPVTFGERGRMRTSAGKRVAVRTGVIDRGRYAGGPPY